MPAFRKGRQAAEAAASRKGGNGDFRPFVPEIKWREDGEKKYILVLTDPDELATLDIHEFIKVGTGEKANGETYPKFESFLSRKDPFLGEDYDDLSDRLDNVPKTRVMGVVVELEPVMETVRGRQRPKGFAVKTDTYTRRTDDGEEEVTYPVMGLVAQSSALMWSPLLSLDDSAGPWVELPIEVTRRFKDANTRYEFLPFMDAPVDLSGVREHFDGLSYLRDEITEVQGMVDAAEDDTGAAMAVAEALFNQRLSELADKDRYDSLVGPIQELENRFGNNNNKKAKAPVSRPSRPSPREASAEVAEEAAEAPAEDNERSARFANLRAQVASKSTEA